MTLVAEPVVVPKLQLCEHNTSPCSHKVLRTVLLLVFFLSLFFLPSSLSALEPSCSSAGSTHSSSAKTTLRFAKGFGVEYHPGYKLLQVFKLDGSLAQEYVLATCPSLVPANYKKQFVIPVPVQSLISLSTTHLEFLNLLGQQDKLIGVSQQKFVSNKKLRQRIKQGKIYEVGPDYNLNLEKILELAPTMMMVTGTDNPKRDGYSSLMNAGIPVVMNLEYQEKTPLATSEWIKFMALFFNEEARAEQIFDTVVREYQDLQKLTLKVSVRPTVLTGSPYKGVWYIAGGQSSLSLLLKDAGAHYLWEDAKRRNTEPMDLERVLEHGADADFWIQPGTWKSINEALVQDSRYGYFQALKPGRIFNNNARLNPDGGNDYWERGIANPHWVLSDLIKIFHPELLPEHKLIWFHALPQKL